MTRQELAQQVLDMWYPDKKQLAELDGSQLILLNMKCFRVADFMRSLVRANVEEELAFLRRVRPVNETNMIIPKSVIHIRIHSLEYCLEELQSDELHVDGPGKLSTLETGVPEVRL